MSNQVDNVVTDIRNRGFCASLLRATAEKPYRTFTEQPILSLHSTFANQIAKNVFFIALMQVCLGYLIYKPFNAFLAVVTYHLYFSLSSEYFCTTRCFSCFIRWIQWWLSKLRVFFPDEIGRLHWKRYETDNWWGHFWRLCSSVEHISDSRNTFSRILSLPMESSRIRSQGLLSPCIQQLISFTGSFLSLYTAINLDPRVLSLSRDK